MNKSFFRSLKMAIFFFIFLGLLYPFVVNLIAKYMFPEQSNGGVVREHGVPLGAKLIGQNFISPKYFHGRPSAAGDHGYDAMQSGASNLAPTNKALLDRMEASIQQILKENPGLKREDIPVDLVTASASGLDPDISMEAALVQIPRIAKERHLSEDKLKSLVEAHTQKPLWGFLGTTHLNVLLLNVSLDKL